MYEIETGRVPWEYYTRVENSNEVCDSVAADDNDVWTGETGIRVKRTDDGNTLFELLTRSKFLNRTTWNSSIIDFLIALQDKIQAHIPSEFMPIHTAHRRSGQVFRGHPNYRGKGPWRDWVWIDWGPDYGRLPCHIWCFVVLEGMPRGRNRIHHGGIPLSDGVFAVVEATELEGTDAASVVLSDLMSPMRKTVDFDVDGFVGERTFFLADTEAFSDPCCVIPDLGGPKNRYFVVKPRNQWAREFIRWVEDPHNLDEMDDLDAVDEDDNLMGKMEEDRPKKKIK